MTEYLSMPKNAYYLCYFLLSRLEVVKALLFRIGGAMETERLINSVSI